MKALCQIIMHVEFSANEPEKIVQLIVYLIW